jgi:hypothetical protein
MSAERLDRRGSEADNLLMHRVLMIAFGRLAVVSLTVAAAVLFAFAAKEFVPPRAFHAKTYPARDEHPAEHVTIAVDPYDMPDKAAVFTVAYKENGILPVHFIVSNDGDQPVELKGMKVQLVTVNRTKLAPASAEDLYRRLSRTSRRGDEPRRSPLPLPRKGPAVGVSKEARQEIETAGFQAQAVEPHSSQAGFLFFDVVGIANPLAGAHLYVTGVRDGQGQELMYFEIPLEKYLTYRPGTK